MFGLNISKWEGKTTKESAGSQAAPEDKMGTFTLVEIMEFQ